MAIHARAIIDKRAEIGDNNVIGPNVIIEGPVQIGNNNRIDAGVIIKSNTSIGNENHIHSYAVIGYEPQDVSFKGGETRIGIGNGNIIREFVTIHRSTNEDGVTRIGNNNYLMINVHIAHDCTVGNDNYIVNGTVLAGYVTLGDNVFLSGLSGVHQFTRIGSYAMIGGITKIVQDIPPFMIADGIPMMIRGVNVIGLRRHGFSPDRRALLRGAYKQLYRSGDNIKSSLSVLEQMKTEAESIEQKDDLNLLITFIRDSKRGICLRSAKEPGDG
jgi:UDP-N-acetylglucosamine acyltransferase